MSAHKKKKAADKGSKKIEIRNAKASFNYTIGDRFEAGIVLLGTEVKSVRAGTMQITEAFCRVEKGELWLLNSYIAPYSHGNELNHAERRKRKLLLHAREISRLLGAVEAGGKSLIPLRVYFKGGLIKVEIALCVGKKLHDKRETMKRKVEMREAERAMRSKYWASFLDRSVL